MKEYKYLGLITVLFITFQLVSDVTAGKIIQLWIFPVSATVLYFPVTYILSDVLTEVYGYAVARSVLWRVLLASVLAGIVYQIVVLLPAASGFSHTDAYAQVLGVVPRVLVGGWIAVFAGEILNNYVHAKMKIWTKGKHLWMRTIGSTVVGQLANTMLFYFIALYAVIPNDLLITSIISGWLIKVAVEVVLTPVTYRIIKTLKRIEGEDHYDTNTDFRPFVIS